VWHARAGLAQVRDNSLDLKPADDPKQMRWPMAVPSLKQGAPPLPNGRLEGITRLELMPARTVAVLAFAEPTTGPRTPPAAHSPPVVAL
jgi:hypothetical protein